MGVLLGVYNIMKDARSIVSSIVSKSIAKEKVGNQCKADEIMKHANKLALFIDSVRTFYYPIKDSIYNILDVRYKNGNLLLKISGKSGSLISNIKRFGPFSIKTNTSYEYDIPTEEQDFIDYYFSVHGFTYGYIDLNQLTLLNTCPNIVGEYETFGLYIRRENGEDIEILSDGEVGSLTGYFYGTDENGDLIDFTFLYFRDKLVDALNAYGIETYSDFSNGLIYLMNPINEEIEGGYIYTTPNVSLCDGVEDRIEIRFPIQSGVYLELFNSAEQLPVITSSNIEYGFIPEACGSEIDFNNIYKEVLRLKLLNC